MNEKGITMFLPKGVVLERRGGMVISRHMKKFYVEGYYQNHFIRRVFTNKAEAFKFFRQYPK
jgi:hypothetical protein